MELEARSCFWVCYNKNIFKDPNDYYDVTSVLYNKEIPVPLVQSSTERPPNKSMCVSRATFGARPRDMLNVVLSGPPY